MFQIFPIPAYPVTCAHRAALELKKLRFCKDRLPEERLSKRSSGFFCRHHSREHIIDGIASGNMGVLVRNNVIAGTGCFDGNYITDVYVLPSYQEHGCDSYIMNCLLQCTKDYNKNGLPTCNFYRSSKERYFIFLKCNDYMLQLRAKLARRSIS